MMLKIRYVAFTAILLCLTGWGPFFSSVKAPIGSSAWVDQETRSIRSQAGNIDSSVLKLSLQAYAKARQRGLDNKGLMTIIDYYKPSSERRLWVVDMNRGKVLFNTWVTHGKNSGTISATSFSNQPGSLKSSIGVFLTDSGPYVGGNGYSLRLHGLEPGINDNAYRRDIVVHGAWYADQSVAQKYGQLGRSWGCPAVPDKLVHPIVDTIKNRTLVFVYYRDYNWLRHSSYLS
jgi:hypothetical protein